jgi:hypothetical protein
MADQTYIVNGRYVSRAEYDAANAEIEAAKNKVLTIAESQATSNEQAVLAVPVFTENQVNQSLSSQDDAVRQAPTSGGVGAGTSSNSFDSRGNDNTPPPSSTGNQQVINQSFANRPITPQPNVLDQYASYTYAISWWILTPDQYNNLSSGEELAPAFGTGNWSLLIQSGGAPIAGRNPAFPLDYYLDDLEIETFLMGKGTGMSTNGMEIKFKIVEPNGLTLLQNLYKATTAVYKNIKAPNYGAAQYCLTIEFYGYDANGNLVAPATGGISGATTQAVIKKYYPFIIQNITFRTVANQVEYMVTGTPVPYATNSAQARGTIPFAYQLAGQTVSQLLVGGGNNSATTTAPVTEGRKTTPSPARVSTPTVADLPMREQAAIAAGTDPNAVTDSGMAFGGGGL